MKSLINRSLHGKELARWLIPPASGWQRRFGRGAWGRLYIPILLLAVLLLTFVLISFSFFISDPLDWRAQLMAGSSGLALIILLVTSYFIRKDLLEPLAHVRNWAIRMKGGSLRARIPVPEGGEFPELAEDINTLSKNLQALSENMQNEVRKQTERIEQKSSTLKILYDVAASINTSGDLDELLSRFLHILINITGARAGMVRLLDDEGYMHLVSSVGVHPADISGEYVVPVDRCQCGKAVTSGSVINKMDMQDCARFNNDQFFTTEDTEMVAVPLVYHGKQLGIYNLFVDRPSLLPGGEDNLNLLTSIGKHLGMAIEKTRLDKESKTLDILEERNQLAHELHDSLAQTLASLRFQIRTLEDAYNNGSRKTHKELERLKSGIDESYREVRDLIGHFRDPSDEQHGLLPAINKAVDDIRKQSNISITRQGHWDDVILPAADVLQVSRIVQEALTNIRKHSEARHVRVLLNQTPREYSILIEDDGIGIAENTNSSHAGDHIGLTVMQERAKRMGGELSIDSEPGEGTQVLLSFPNPNLPKTQSKAQELI
ncbi:MAG: GAF domain-containing protein [Gammaproteobacteria bacterium]|nr:GAF domain-containing protein [Gammaproteobacteria bacterium]